MQTEVGNHPGRVAERMWIKICGITQIEDALVVASSGASAIGLNFYEGSRRFISVDRAVPIAAAVRASAIDEPLDVVGVFVDSAVANVVEIARQVSLTAVQFHGDEPASLIAEFHRLMPEIRIIRAIRVSMDRVERCFKDLDRLQDEVPLTACLMDAFDSGEFGGTGRTIDLRIAERYRTAQRPRLVLAGGLTPDNVGAVIQQAGPWGVDTASGVESAPGQKHPERIRAFAASALSAALQRRIDAPRNQPTPFGRSDRL